VLGLVEPEAILFFIGTVIACVSRPGIPDASSIATMNHCDVWMPCVVLLSEQGTVPTSASRGDYSMGRGIQTSYKDMMGQDHRNAVM